MGIGQGLDCLAPVANKHSHFTKDTRPQLESNGEPLIRHPLFELRTLPLVLERVMIGENILLTVKLSSNISYKVYVLVCLLNLDSWHFGPAQQHQHKAPVFWFCLLVFRRAGPPNGWTSLPQEEISVKCVS